MALKLIDRLVKSSGWSVATRFPYELVDAEGVLIETIWLRPLSRAEVTNIRNSAGDNVSEISLRMICSSCYMTASGADKAFDITELPKLNRELSSAMLNNLETALLNIDKPASNLIETEKKD